MMKKRKEPSKAEKELWEQLRYGSAKDAIKAIKKLFRQLVPRARYVRRREVEEMLEFREASDWVKKEYKKEIFDKPQRKKMFVAMEKRLRERGDCRPYKVLYAHIGEKLSGRPPRVL